MPSNSGILRPIIMSDLTIQLFTNAKKAFMEAVKEQPHCALF
jgi:hypothetical protein